jgi:tetratricopeptide (TPR) repeat protein
VSGSSLAAVLVALLLVGSPATSTFGSMPSASARSAHALVPPPPPALLRPGLLDPSARLGADLSLTETLEALGGPATAPDSAIPVSPRLAPSPDAEAKAARLYVQAHAASLENQLLLAATKFEEALALDPQSPDLLAGYAQILSRLGNSTKAIGLYERLLAADPGRPEALLSIGLQAASRGEVDATIRALAPLMIPHPATPEGKEAAAKVAAFWDSLRDDAVLAVELSLARALNESGADKALLELLDRSFARAAPTLSGWPAIECRRVAGDARARRGDLAGALSDWRTALTMMERDAATDPALSPLVARVLWAERATSIDAATPPANEPAIETLRHVVSIRGVRDEWIALAEWFASTAQPGTPTDDALRAFASSVDVRIGDPDSARLAAALAPSRAFERLAASHDRRQPDRAHVAAWLAAAAAISPARAVEIATNLLGDAPLEPELIISGLLGCGVDAPTLLATAAERPDDARRVALRIRLLARYERTGDAWRIGSEALETRANDPTLLRAMLTVAAIAKRSEAIPSLIARLDAKDLTGQLDALRALVAIGDTEKAGPLSERIAGAAGDSQRILAIARGLYANARAADAARARDRAGVEEAIRLLRAAVDADPRYEFGWSQLLTMTRVLFPSDQRRAMSDEEKSLRRDVTAALPNSIVAFMIARETMLAQGRSGDALEALIARSAAAPWDGALLGEATAALATSGRIAETLAFLDDRIARAPADPIPWQRWTEATIAAGQAAEALERLDRNVDGVGAGDDPIAQRLRAQPLRALGREAEAAAVEEEELNQQAPSARRDIARIAKFIDAHKDEEASTLLGGLAERREELAAPEAFAGLELALRLTNGPARDGFVRTFAEDLLGRADDASRSSGMEPAAIVRAAGAIALVSRGPERAAEREALATKALAAQARGVMPIDPQAASVWLDLAQRFADDDAFAEGSDFLAALVRSDLRMTPAVAARLATACFALDAAARDRAERSIAMLDLVRSRGVRPFAGRERSVDRDSDELYLLAGLYSLIADSEGSRAILNESLRRDPKHAMSLNNLAWDRMEAGEAGPDIVTMIEAAHAALPGDASVLDSIGWLRYKQGRFEEAVELLGKAITASGDDPSMEVVDHFGDAVWRRGNRDAAAKAWAEVGSLGERFYSRDLIVGRLPTYETNEHGVRVIDAEALWQRSYGSVLERAAAKRQAVADGAEPAVAPVWPPAAEPVGSR